MLLNYGLIQVLRVEADMKGTIRLVGACEGRYPFGRPGDSAIAPLATMTLRVHSIFSHFSMGTFPPSVLDQGYVRVSPNGVGTWHVTSNELGKTHLRATMS